ncbi:HAD-IIB family hydrolase [Thalassolituus sp. LLYu03]|uniref:HAD-IIB family hydrolase n=1 Tax=Thalassolituus sp. LLYu03 TaxID=3421656 RepID=UPI003D2E93AD
MNQLPLIVITDLDGTLLDHKTYEFRAAQPALSCLRQMKIPCILNSSKTFDEMLGLRERLQNKDPFVCENGGAVFVPRDPGHGFNSEVTGSSYNSILKVLHQLRTQGFHFRGFNDMTATEVAAMTGLSTDDAELARRRNASEPIIWQDAPERLDEFASALSCHNLRLLKGGRFYHVMGMNDKSEAITFFRDYYRNHWQQEIKVIAIGDSDNDLAMLEAADFPIVIPGENATLTPANPAAIIAACKGPQGFNDALLALLKTIGKEQRHG